MDTGQKRTTGICCRCSLLLDTTAAAAVEGRRKSCFRFASSGSDDFGGFCTENQFDDLFPPWSMDTLDTVGDSQKREQYHNPLCLCYCDDAHQLTLEHGHHIERALAGGLALLPGFYPSTDPAHSTRYLIQHTGTEIGGQGNWVN